MDLYQAVHGRRTIHAYLSDAVKDDVLMRLLDAAHMAPNHKLTWPWRFTVVGLETRSALLPIAYRLKNAEDESLQRRIREKLMEPGALVVVTQERSEDEFRRREDYAATCCAIQNLMLAATAEGLGSKWSTGSLTQHPDVCRVLELDSTQEEVVGFVWVGTPKKVPVIDRPPIDNHVRRLP